MITTAVAGFFTSLGFIVAIGAQNAYILRQGIRREHTWMIIAVCAISDIVLIFAGTAGVGAILTSAPALIEVMRWCGAAYLLWFAYQSVRSAVRPQGLIAEAGQSVPMKKALLAVLAITWLNPHVYLDTVIMVGSIANHQGPDARWWFATGASLASVVWFLTIGLGARGLSGVLAKPRAWQLLDFAIAGIMAALAVMLIVG